MTQGPATGYSSLTQKARVITENWVAENGYCPNCGEKLSKLANNSPVADFCCRTQSCLEQYELKSKANAFGKVINDGAYHTIVSFPVK